MKLKSSFIDVSTAEVYVTLCGTCLRDHYAVLWNIVMQPRTTYLSHLCHSFVRLLRKFVAAAMHAVLSHRLRFGC
jgi:hypothetical protein